MSTVPLPPDYYKQPEPPRGRNWKRIIGIGVAILSIIVTVLFMGMFALLQNQTFRQYLIRNAQQRVSEALGAQVQVRDFDLHLSRLNPAVDMYDVVVAGAEPYTNPPLLQADRLSLSVRIDSFARREWYFSNIEIEHPIARVVVDDQGRTNLPPAPSGQSQTDVFDLGVRHVVLNRGELYYNDRKSSIDADLRNLAFQSGFDPDSRRYSGNLSYRDGNLRIEMLNPVIHSLEARFEATPGQLKLNRAFVTTGASQFTLTATLDDYAQPRVQAGYEARINSGDLRQVLKNSSLPAGVVDLVGSLKYHTDPNLPLLETLSLDGNASSAAVQVQSPNGRLPVRDVSARYALEKGNLTVRDLRARVLGGALAGNLTVRDVTGAAESQLHASLKNLGLAEVQTLMKTPVQRDVLLDGTAEAVVDAKWKKSFSNLMAHADTNLSATIKPGRAGATGDFPLTGEFHVRYDAAGEQISLTQSYVRTSQTSVNLNGTISNRASLEVQLQSKDLREVETIVRAFHPIEPIGISGAASFVGTVRGSVGMPLLAGQLRAAPIQVRGSDWRLFQANIEASPSLLSLRNGVLQAVPQGQLAFNLSVGLTGWSYSDTSPIDINLNASQLDAAHLVSLAGQQTPVSGTLSANVSVHGSQLNPIGQGTINLTRATVYEEPIDSFSANFQGTGTELRTKLDLRIPAGGAQGNLIVFPMQKAYEAQLEATGIRLDRFHALRSRNMQLVGTLDLKASGKGTLEDPELQLSAQVPRLQIDNQVINALTLQANVADHVADIALNSEALNTYLRGRGKVSLSGNYDVDATLDTSPISLQPLVATYLPTQANAVGGQTEIHAKLRGPLKDKSLLTANITIPVLALNYKNSISIAATSPVQLDYAKGILTLQRTMIRGTGTDLRLEGTFPIANTAPPAITALGTVDLKLAQLMSPDITSSGQIRFNIDSTVRKDNPNVQGQIEIVGASLTTADVPIGLQNGNGVLRLTNDRLEIERFRGDVGSGMLTAQGTLTYRPSLQFAITTTTKGVRLLYPDGVRETVDTNLTMTGSPQAAILRGQVSLSDLSFTPNFDLAEILGQFSGATTAPAQGFARNLQLEIGVQSTNDVNLVSTKLSLQGAANLQVRGTAAAPVMVGRVNLSGGDLIFRGNRYVLQPSTLDFVNPVRTEPIVNLAVDSVVQQYNVHLRLRGPVDRLQTTYTSDPALPPADIINLLAFGKTTEAEAANPTPANMGAESLIASSVSSQITNRVSKVAGISQLSVDPVLGGSQKNPGARVTIQQRVTGNLFVTFSSDVTGTEDETIKLEYQVSPKVSLSGVRDQNGGFALDMRIRKTW